MSPTKTRLFGFALLLFTCCLMQTGCAMCCGTYDEAYNGYGGLYEREDLFHGRVGSPFSDPSAAYRNAEYVPVDGEDIEELAPIQQ